MPIAHGNGHARIEIPVELAFEGNSLAPGKFEQRRFAADAGIMMRHVFGAPGGNQSGQRLSRDPRNPLRFRVSRRADARSARTRYRRIAVSEAAAGQVGVALSWLACRLDTGRTHQIRVHLESVGHPLVGDPLYSKRRPPTGGAALGLKRQALHASRLALKHPGQGVGMAWFRPPPDDLRELMQAVGFAADRPVDAFGADRTR